MALSVFFFNDTATTEIYTLSLHDALPIYGAIDAGANRIRRAHRKTVHRRIAERRHVLTGNDVLGQNQPIRLQNRHTRSEEHTSELQSRQYLVCRLLLEKKTTAHASTTPAK